MVIADIVFWWYSRGWGVFIKKVMNSLGGVTDFFSMDSLLRTLFKPYRQISAQTAGEGAAVDTKFQMFIDRLISRLVGFVSRLILLLVGLVIIVVGGVISLILIIIWPVVPFLPVAGVVLAVMGVII